MNITARTLATAAIIIAATDGDYTRPSHSPTPEGPAFGSVPPVYKSTRSAYIGMLPHVDTSMIDVDAVIRQSRQARLERNRKKL